MFVAFITMSQNKSSEDNMKNINLFAVATLFLLLRLTTSHAAIITVNAANGGISFNDGFCSLSEAIKNANSDSGLQVDCTSGSGTDTIVLANDVTLDSIYTSNDPIYGATGTPTIVSPMTIDGDGFTLQRDNNLSCVLDSNSQPGEFRLLHQLDENNLLTIKHITLANGCADSYDIPNQTSRYGGALFGLFINIRDVNFINNKATFNGGAIFATNIQGIRSSTFLNNYADFNGGAISLGGTSTTITNSTFSANTSGHFGGAIYLRSNAILNNTNNSTFHNNKADKGGAIYSDGIVTNLTNSIFHFNAATGSGFAFDDCQKSGVSSGDFNGTNNISNHIDSDSNCPGLIQPRLQSADIISIANNGGSTMTHALTHNSTAIDKAINGTSEDQRGASIVAIRDLGAYEVQRHELCVGDFDMGGFNVNVTSATELQHAIMCSNFNASDPDTINLNNNITFDAPYEIITGTGGDNATPIISTPIIINGQGFSINRDNGLNCQLDGNQDAGEFRLYYIDFNGGLTLQNVIIENGCTDGIDEQQLGGAIYNKGDLSLVDSIINDNHAYVSGGAVYNETGQITLISNSSFIQNSANSGSGAAIYHAGGTINEINNSIFTDNSSQVSGGAISNHATINVIEGSSFLDNSSDGSGGAIDNNDFIFEISKTTFANNTSSTTGGAINNFVDLILLMNNTFSGNSSVDDGGAIFNNDLIERIENNTFSGNSAGNIGGAIYVSVSADIDILKNSLFHNNSNRDCVSFSGSINGINNITDQDPIPSGCPGLIASRLTAVTVKQLADNGGPTMTHGLQPGSEALDASVGGLPTDQRGLAANGVRDIGAFEAQLNELCSGALQVNGFTTDVANVDELYYAISCSKVNGSNPDTINLSADIILYSEYENDVSTGLTGTPGLTSPLILDGQGFTIERDSNLSCNLDDNNDPGEFRLLHNHPGNSLTIRNLALLNGCADADGGDQLAKVGGGLYNEGILAIINTSFIQNQARSGGAIYHFDGTITEITNSTFAANTATALGGAILNSSDIILVENTTFSGNSALTNSGGAILNLDTISNIINSTFSGNSASLDGGAIANGVNNNITIRNTLFHDNGVDECHDNNNSIIGNNNISDNALGGCPALIASTLTTNTIAPLAVNGGFTQTHALLPNSEALNNASNGLSKDQRGFFVTDGSRDIGAFEDQVPVVTAPADINIEATSAMTVLTEAIIGSAVVNDPEQPALTASPSGIPNIFPLGTHMITWSATDYHGHMGSDTQDVTIVDTTPPTINLLGNAVITLNIGDSYIDAGAFATDQVDGNLTGSIVIINPVNTALAGSYTVTYDVQDNSGNNAAQATRLVKVQATIGGTISGLVNTNTVTISDGNESLVLGNGGYTFNTSLDSGSNYSVSITVQPAGSSIQTCEISNNTGTVSSSNINNINVVCTASYFVGGMASGLANGNAVDLTLGAENLNINSNVAFVFLNPLSDGSNYLITVASQPTVPNQTCDLVNPSGSISGGDVMNVEVNCSTNTYTIGGSVIGLHAGNNLILQNNDGDDLLINTDGDFDFVTELDDMSDYAVTISSQPNNPIQPCVVNNSSGIGVISGEHVTTVEISCDFGDDLIFPNGFE